MIIIVDYGLGNLGSIKNMLNKIGYESDVTSDITLINDAEKLILPGVGAFDQGMKNLEEMGLIPILNQKILIEKTPILGICLGMQLMGNRSEEGVLEGLRWIDAETFRFENAQTDKRFPVPHIGWEYVLTRENNPLVHNLPDKPKFYFAHSFYVKCNKRENVLLTSEYIHKFDSGFQKENILGVQFHPEKSHKYGMKLLANFCAFF